jgi:Tfp pilus assembly protein PilF
MLDRLLKRLIGGQAAPGAAAPSQPRPASAPPARAPLFKSDMERGRECLAKGDIEGARTAFERELANDPLSGPAHAALAELDRRDGRIDAAIAHYMTVTVRHPDEPAILNNLGSLYIETGQFEEAIRRLERAVAFAPDMTPARENLARALFNARRFEEAETHERVLVARNPDSVALHFRLGHMLLMEGKLDEGWPEHEWRLREPGFEQGVAGLPRWDGSDAAGKSIRVIAEQGLGDAILFSRFVTMLAARGAEVEFLVPPTLARLFAASFASERVRVRTDAAPDALGLDAHVHLLSLPYRLAVPRDALRADGAYLRVPHEAREKWQPRIAPLPGFKVGIAWAGHPERRGDESRTIAPEILTPLAMAAPGITWVSLQAGLAPDAPRPFPIMTDPMGDVTDYADTAAIIEALDLVVSADTSVAHAAAALGKPVILLAPHNVCWRWDMGGVESPWYPGVKVFRARGRGEWGAVVENASAAIAEAAANVKL